MVEAETENAQVYAKLVDAVAGGAIALVGAGSSLRVGYPGWTELIAQLRERALAADASLTLPDPHTASDLLSACSAIEEAVGQGKFRVWVSELLGPREPQHLPFHTALVSLPFRHFMTTNADPVLESAHRSCFGTSLTELDVADVNSFAEFVDGLSSPASTRHCVHLHGVHARPHDIILTLADFRNRYLNSTRVTTILQALFAQFPLVLIGCGMNRDDMLLGNFEALAAAFGTGVERHFAILPSGSPQESVGTRDTLKRRHRASVLFYDSANNHAALEDVLRQLHADVTRKQQERAPQLMVRIARDAGLLPEHAGAFEQQVTSLLRQTLLGSISTGTAPIVDRTPLDDQLDSIFEFVTKGLPDEAIRQYDALLAKSGTGLSPRLKYRLLANTGVAFLAKGSADIAGAKLIEAVSGYRTTREARGNEAFGYVLLGNLDQARQLATALCADEPDFPRAHMLRLRSAPADADFAALLASVPDSCRSDGEVALSLCNAAQQRGLQENREQWARVAVAAKFDWLDALTELATAILESEQRRAVIDGDRGLVAWDAQRVEESVTLFDQALETVPRTDPRGHRPLLLFNRSQAKRLLGREQEAIADLDEAFRLAPTQVEIVCAQAKERVHRGDLTGAIELLESSGAIDKDPTALVLYGSAVLSTPGSAKVDALLPKVLVWVSKLDDVITPSLRADLTRLAVGIHVYLKRLAAAEQLVQSLSPDHLGPVVRHALLARIAYASENKELGDSSVQAALAAITDSTPWLDKRDVAVAAQMGKRWEDALQVWKRVASTRFWNSDTRNMIACAQRVGDDAFVLQCLRELRVHGHWNADAIGREAELLLQYHEPAAAIDLVQSWSKRQVGSPDSLLLQSMVALRTGRHDLVVSDVSRLPRAENIEDVEDGAQVAFVLRRGLVPIAGVKYAYELLRRFPDAQTSQRTMFSVILDPLASPLPPMEMPQVGFDAVVHVLEQGARNPLEVIVEDGPLPSVQRNEYPSTHALVQAMWGKKREDAFTFNGRDYRVVGLDHKWRHAANRSLELFDVRNPTQRVFRRFEAPRDPSPSAEPEAILGKDLADVLRADDERRQTLETLYRERRAPIGLMARALDRPVFDTMRHVALAIGHDVHCCHGVPQEYEDALKALQADGTVVLDSTALATLFLLDSVDVLLRPSRRFIVPQAVLDDVEKVIDNLGPQPREHGAMGFVNGSFFVQHIPAEQSAAFVDRAQRFIEALKSSCEIEGGRAFLELSYEERSRLEGYLGEGCAHAAAIARKRQGHLWTDDLASAGIAAEVLGVPRVWSQAVLRHAHVRGAYSFQRLSQSTGQLLAIRYVFTGITVGEAVEMLRANGWKTDGGSAEAAFAELIRVGGANPLNMRIVTMLIWAIWIECPSERTAAPLILRLLDGIGRGISGPKIAKPLYRLLPHTIISRRLPGVAGSMHGRTVDVVFGAHRNLSPKLRRLKRLLRRWRSHTGLSQMGSDP